MRHVELVQLFITKVTFIYVLFFLTITANEETEQVNEVFINCLMNNQKDIRFVSDQTRLFLLWHM